MMIDLFGNLIEEKKKPNKSNLIEWSPSKALLLRQCSRQYYYKYYGSHKRKAKNQPFKSELNFCKAFTNKYLLVGKIIHSAIAKFYRDIIKNQYENNADQLIGHSKFILEKVIEYSEKKLENPEYKGGKHDVSILMEIYEGRETTEEIIEFATLRFNSSISNFFKEKYDFLMEFTEETLIERKFTIYPFSNCRITGVLDLAFDNGDQYIINDWKTGFVEVENTSLQMLTYAIWAKENLGDKKISLFKTYLIEDKIVPLEFNERHLLRAKANLMQDCEEMIMLDEFGKGGNFKAFGKCNQEKICNQCPYQTICIKN